jgi:hypothetical protein
MDVIAGTKAVGNGTAKVKSIQAITAGNSYTLVAI